MKQTNNAIKFLLAQYRAIYKHAYAKGVLSALVLTSGLAIGTANAVAGNNDLEISDIKNKTSNDIYNIEGAAATNITAPSSGGPGKYQSLRLESSSISNFDGTININGGSFSRDGIGEEHNHIKNASLSGEGKLIIKTGHKVDVTDSRTDDGGVSIWTSGEASSVVDLHEISITNEGGNLHIINQGNAKTNSTTVVADIINIHSGNTKAQRSVLQFGSNSVTGSGDLTLGKLKTDADSGTLISLKGNEARLVANGGTSGDASILAEKITIDSGAAFFGKVLTEGQKVTLKSRNVELNDGEFMVHRASSGDFVIDLTHTESADGTKVAGQFNANGGVVNINSKLTLAGGVLNISDDAKLVVAQDLTTDLDSSVLDKQSEDYAYIHISGSNSLDTAFQEENKAVLRLTSKTLKGFLDGGVSGNFTDGNGTGKSEAGAIQLSNYGILEFTDTEAVDLAKFAWNSGDISAAHSKQIHVSGSGIVSGSDITVSEALHDGTTSKTAVNTSLHIYSTNLTLGSTSYTNETDGKLGFSNAITNNVEFITSNTTTPYLLGDSITLRSIKLDGKDLVKGESGSIVGDVTVSGSLTVDGGIYEAKDKIIVSSGDLNITNTKEADKSYLTLSNLTLDQTQDNTINITGKNSVLDISNADVTLDKTLGNDKKTTITISGSGELITNASNLNKLLTTNAIATSGTAFVLSGGTLSVTDNLTLDSTKLIKLISGATVSGNAILFSGDGSSLDINGSLTLQGATDESSKVAIGSNTINATSLSVENKAALGSGVTENSFELTSGTFTLDSGLSSTGNTKSVVVKTTVNLGSAEEFERINNDSYFVVASESGRVNTNLNLQTATAKVVVDNGAWTGQDVTINSGSMTVGGAADRYDINNKLITASFDGKTLNVSGGSFNVLEDNVATFTDVKTSGENQINVTGEMNISGSKTEDKFNFSIADNSIQVNNYGKLNFGEVATSAITVSGDAVTIAEGTIGTIKLLSGGEVSFAFSSGDAFNEKAIADLRLDLFGSAEGTLPGRINLGNATITGLTDQISGGQISWDKVYGYSDIVSSTTTNDLKGATVTNIDSSDDVRGHFGALSSETIQGSSVNITDNSSLSTANNGKFAFNSKTGEVLGINIKSGASLELANGGEAKNITLNDDAELIVRSESGVTALASITGSGDATILSGVTNVAGAVDVRALNTHAGSVLNVDSIEASDESVLLGSLNVTKNAEFNEVYFDGGKNEFKSDLTINKFAGLYANTIVSGTTTFKDDAEIGQGSLFKANKIKLDSLSVLSVGEDSYEEFGELKSGSTGYLEAKQLELNGGVLIVDPEYNQATSVAAIESFKTSHSATKTKAGYADGDIILAQNSALMVGEGATVAAMQDFIKRYQVDGKLLDPETNEDGVGAVLGLNSKLVLKDGNRIIIDPVNSKREILGNDLNPNDPDYLVGELEKDKADSKYTGKYKPVNGTETIVESDLYLGQGSVLFVNDSVLSEKNDAVAGAIHFDKDDASVKGESGAKIVLGDAYVDVDNNVTLFTDKGTGDAAGVKILDNDIRVESLNGLMYFILGKNTESTGGQFKVDTSKLETSFLSASGPSRDTLMKVTFGVHNYEDAIDMTTGDFKPDVKRDYLHGEVAPKGVTVDETTGNVVIDPSLSNKYQANQFVVVGNQAYWKVKNAFLDNAQRNSDGAAVDQVGRMSAFGGAGEAAFAVGQTNADAIAARIGMGAQNSGLSFADNGQGAGLWLAPIYKNHESDGFSAEGFGYGVDIDMYGLALGGDYTMSNGLRVGLMFNVGSGDADGQGAGQGVSNDFNYYGFGMYAGFSVDKFSVVGDVSYSVIDNDMTATTSIDKTKATMDSTALSLGVTAQYALAFNGLDVTPHAGLRFTRIDIDDYSVKGEKFADIGSFDGADANVFSIPVGVTIAKNIVTGSWTIKPSFDLTLTGNFGDDTLDGTMDWSEYTNLSTAYSTEFVDSFTYGATLGIAAKNGNFSLGLGANYTGSSNTDSYGINASARFVF